MGRWVGVLVILVFIAMMGLSVIKLVYLILIYAENLVSIVFFPSLILGLTLVFYGAWRMSFVRENVKKERLEALLASLGVYFGFMLFCSG